jgi:hypothetical protein
MCSPKVIFILVNMDSHWSLMEVFSLLMVSVVVDVHKVDTDEMEWPALIFLDSLKLHDATAITKKLGCA